MLKERSEQIQFTVAFVDAIVCIIAFFTAFYIRNSSLFIKYGPTQALEVVSWILGASLGLHFILFPFFKFYESIRLKPVPKILLMITQAALAEFFILGTMVFLLQEKDTSRYFFILFIGINYLLLTIEKIFGKVFLTRLRGRGYNFRQVLIVGAGTQTEKLISTLKRNAHWGYVPFGILLGPGETKEDAKIFEGVPCFGDLSEFERIITVRAVDEVFFLLKRVDPAEIGTYVRMCEQLGINARIGIDFFEIAQSRTTFMVLDHLPVITFYTALKTPFQHWIKRGLDIVISLVGLLITAIVYPWIYFKTQKESPGPIIFKQSRVGENGRLFKCYKFRTMSLNADELKLDLQKQNMMQGPLFKVENDPRVFKFGHFLRKSSLDELPQFLNILRGDMSLVGTRPPTPDEVNKYELRFRRRLSIRPGLTGLWQVSGRNSIVNFESVLKLDLDYIDRWSLWLDFQIIFKTIWIVCFRRGAF